MSTLKIFVALGFVAALAACGGTADNSADAPATTASIGTSTSTGTSNEAEEFAARINGGAAGTATTDTTQALPVAKPRVAATSRAGAADGPFVAGTATDPASATCGANVLGEFIGQTADVSVRTQILERISGANEVRFLLPGSSYVEPDPASDRLNIMLDANSVVRDIRCG